MKIIRNFRNILNTLIILSGVLISAMLLAACDSSQPAPSINSSQTNITLVPADQAIPTKVPPTPTAVPTPTEQVLLIPTTQPAGQSSSKGSEPAALTNLQNDLLTQAAKYNPPVVTKASGTSNGNTGVESTTVKAATTIKPATTIATKQATPTPTRKPAVSSTNY